MSVIPELILQTAIIRGFRALRADTRLIDDIFRDTSQRQLAQIKEFILENPIDLSINYPKQTELRVPSFVILLKNETESDPFLGDLMGTGHASEELLFDTLGGTTASVSDLDGLPPKLLGPLNVVSATVGSLTFAESALSGLIEEPPGCAQLYVVSGSGAGKVYDIIRLRSNSLDIEGTFDPQLDSTSVVEIRDVANPIPDYGQPSRVYDANNDFVERLGAIYDTQYQVSVIAGNQDEVIYLYSILKALLLSQRKFLESNGIMVLKMSGSDFAPRSEYLPLEAFQRVMNLQFKYPFEFNKELETFNNLELALTPEDPFTLATCEEIVTTITL